jgi:hypothetical protein
VRWQFFGKFTFKQERLPKRVRNPMFNAALRQFASEHRLSFPRLNCAAGTPFRHSRQESQEI